MLARSKDMAALDGCRRVAAAALTFALSLMPTGPTIAQRRNLPSTADFMNILTVCGAGSGVRIEANLQGSISSVYEQEKTQGKAIQEILAKIIELLPENQRLAAYSAYLGCVDKFVAAVPPPVTVTYRVCSGEYERACQQHDTYLYCGADVKAWANARCTASTIQRLNTYGGNKCGYSIDAVICTGPK
jgi:hypothetical protein